MLRALFVGDLSTDTIRRERATDVIVGCRPSYLEPVDATIRLVDVTDDAAPMTSTVRWRLAKTASRLQAMRRPHAPSVLVGFDPLHLAIACHLFPATPWVVHVDGMGSGVPPMPLDTVMMLPGLHEVLGAVLRGASAVLASHPRNVETLRRQWGVDADRIYPCPLDAGCAVPHYIDGTRAMLRERPARFAWFLDLWQVHARPQAVVAAR